MTTDGTVVSGGSAASAVLVSLAASSGPAPSVAPSTPTTGPSDAASAAPVGPTGAGSSPTQLMSAQVPTSDAAAIDHECRMDERYSSSVAGAIRSAGGARQLRLESRVIRATQRHATTLATQNTRSPR